MKKWPDDDIGFAAFGFVFFMQMFGGFGNSSYLCSVNSLKFKRYGE